MVVYLDVVWLVEMAMNSLLLFLTGRLAGGKRDNLRILGAAALGAVWSCISCVLEAPGWILWCMAWLINGSLMILTAFGWSRAEDFIRRLAMFWMVTAAAGGSFELVGEVGVFSGSVQAAQEAYPAGRAAAAAAGVLFFGLLAGNFMSRWRVQKNRYYQVRLAYQGRTTLVWALLDTGNTLYEPYGHHPVHVITKEACQELIGSWSKVLYIPFRSVGAAYGLLPGICIDRMEVLWEGRLVKSLERPWLAVTKEPLSACRCYEMLLHGEQEDFN